MTQVLPKLMTVEEFLDWDSRQPKEAGTFEFDNGRIIVLHSGEVTAQSERVRHIKTKTRVYNALVRTLQRNGLDCWVLPDGAVLRLPSGKIYKPDGLLGCGPEPPDDSVEIEAPGLIVEVLSDSSVKRDHGEKAIGYFTLPSVQHYLIVDPDEKLIIHHRRAANNATIAQIVRSGSFRIDPPGFDLDLADVFDV